MDALSRFVLERLDRHHPETAAHSRRVADLLLCVCPELGPRYWHAAACHDAGKLFFGDDLLSSPGPPTLRQWELIHLHPKLGVEVLREYFGSLPSPLYDMARFHHERWDGWGYPDHLAGEAIPACARLLAILDAFDAMTSARPYRRPKSRAEAIAALVEGAASQFDPTLVPAVLPVLAVCPCGGP